LTPGQSWAGLGPKMAMKIFGFALASLFLSGPVLAQTPTARPPMDAEIKRAQTVELNGLITQLNAAVQAKDWPKAKDLAGKLITANDKLAAAYPDDPDFPSYEPADYKLLGDAQLNLGEYKDAIVGYEKCAGLAQVLRDGGKDSLALQKTMGAALTSEGNAWLKLKRNKEAMACYERAIPFDSNPATAWFNLSATKYNIGDMDGAVAAAEKVIALDPTKADAYFIKGSALFGNGTLDASGKFVVSAQAMAALRKYLELAPRGGHADDAKQMLEAPGISVK
jgi:tetratricopeptide (TPR) repeat protein